jgi:hypothetical protein
LSYYLIYPKFFNIHITQLDGVTDLLLSDAILTFFVIQPLLASSFAAALNGLAHHFIALVTLFKFTVFHHTVAVVAGVAVHVQGVFAFVSCALTKAFCCCNICQANWFLKSNNLLYVSNTYLSFVLAYCVVN